MLAQRYYLIWFVFVGLFFLQECVLIVYKMIYRGVLYNDEVKTTNTSQPFSALPTCNQYEKVREILKDEPITMYSINNSYEQIKMPLQELVIFVTNKDRVTEFYQEALELQVEEFAKTRFDYRLSGRGY